MADESYTKIPNDLLNALAVYKFNGRQRAILDVICRYTFGFNRECYKFPVALFEAITGIKQNNVSAELAKLVKAKVVTIIGNPTKTETRIYAINMDYQQWLIEKRINNSTIEINSNTIENNTNENDIYLLPNSIVNYSRDQEEITIENDRHIIKNFNNKSNKKINKIVDSAKAQPTDPQFLPDSFEMKCVETIIHSCLELYPNSKVPSTYQEKEKWAIEIDRMKRLDNRTEEEIRQALEFAVNNSFWKPNIRSGKKFREKYETLIIQYKQKRQGNKNSNKAQQLQDDFIENMKGWLSENDTAGIH